MDALKEELPKPVLTDELRDQLAAIFERRIAIYRHKEGEQCRWADEYTYGEVVAHTVEAIDWLAAECGLPLKNRDA